MDGNDAGVPQLGQFARFQEQLAGVTGTGPLDLSHFHRDRALEPLVEPAVHRAEPARAQLFAQFVTVAERCGEVGAQVVGLTAGTRRPRADVPCILLLRIWFRDGGARVGSVGVRRVGTVVGRVCRHGQELRGWANRNGQLLCNTSYDLT